MANFGSNYPPGVSGNEPEIAGVPEPDEEKVLERAVELFEDAIFEICWNDLSAEAQQKFIDDAFDGLQDELMDDPNGY